MYFETLLTVCFVCITSHTRTKHGGTWNNFISYDRNTGKEIKEQEQNTHQRDNTIEITNKHIIHFLTIYLPIHHYGGGLRPPRSSGGPPSAAPHCCGFHNGGWGGKWQDKIGGGPAPFHRKSSPSAVPATIKTPKWESQLPMKPQNCSPNYH